VQKDPQKPVISKKLDGMVFEGGNQEAVRSFIE
jgi:hypothetical protein